MLLNICTYCMFGVLFYIFKTVKSCSLSIISYVLVDYKKNQIMYTVCASESVRGVIFIVVF